MNNPFRPDKTDLEILRLLEQDGRMPHKVIAQHVHKSITPIHSRLAKLQNEGYIRRFTALLNPRKIGRGLTAYTQVILKVHSQESLENFMKQAEKINEVMECYHLTGAFDFLLRITIRDMDAYNELLLKKLSNLPEVAQMQTSFVISEAKYNTAYFYSRSDE
ncbi:Lrp/AsnC family transcriptional regulator [Mucilaginibacter conchicola]|uniref:Lrp/AsnC family transcriptional regulator n=1 Tax=Mucilaginibacter conchicola TaxID=2303333 RepID=A0A372NM98_9SPHI|nr:Lrp/AsnC family transcriptional regulator [Mucilaginibacter conchicola]RFZ90064.1 Lrp/AsnC family transcriptional regulator [Mucilaginibacter conchicola]